MADSAPTADVQTPDPASSADSPAGASGDSGENSPTPQQPVDYEARFRATQAALTAATTARAQAERERDEALSALDPDPDEGDGEGDPQQVQPRRRGGPTQREIELEEALESARWQQAEAIYGGDVMAAYEKFAAVVEADETPTGYLTALEAYHQARIGGAAPAAAQGQQGTLPTREQAVAPQVDTNRPEAQSPTGPIDPKQYAGGANGGAGAFFRDLLGRSQS